MKVGEPIAHGCPSGLGSHTGKRKGGEYVSQICTLLWRDITWVPIIGTKLGTKKGLKRGVFVG
jgi:integrase